MFAWQTVTFLPRILKGVGGEGNFFWPPLNLTGTRYSQARSVKHQFLCLHLQCCNIKRVAQLHAIQYLTTTLHTPSHAPWNRGIEYCKLYIQHAILKLYSSASEHDHRLEVQRWMAVVELRWLGNEVAAGNVKVVCLSVPSRHALIIETLKTVFLFQVGSFLHTRGPSSWQTNNKEFWEQHMTSSVIEILSSVHRSPQTFRSSLYIVHKINPEYGKSYHFASIFVSTTASADFD
jgi:hypothetical protein